MKHSKKNPSSDEGKHKQNLHAFLDYGKLRKAANILKSVNHPTSQKIIDHLSEKQYATLSQISTSVKLDNSIVRGRVSLLLRSKVLTTSKFDNKIIIEINQERLVQIRDFVCALNNHDLN